MLTDKTIKSVTLWVQIRSSTIREKWQLEDQVRCVGSRRRQWINHVDRTDQSGMKSFIQNKLLLVVNEKKLKILNNFIPIGNEPFYTF